MIEDIQILFGEHDIPKRAKKRERIKNKHTKKIDNLQRGAENDDKKYMQRLNNAWTQFERRYNSQRGFSDVGSGYSERGSGQFPGISDPENTEGMVEDEFGVWHIGNCQFFRDFF